jgi:hypothetical protein
MHNFEPRTFGGLFPIAAVDRAEHFFRLDHLRQWFTPERRRLISARAIDELAGYEVKVSFWRFLKGHPNVTFRITGLERYYAVLSLVGYQPPTDEEILRALGQSAPVSEKNG